MKKKFEKFDRKEIEAAQLNYYSTTTLVKLRKGQI